MDILHLLQIQSRIIPEISEKFNSRYNLMLIIKNNQPVGRKSLLAFTELTERQLRTESDVLSKLGLISKEKTGMSLTEKGEDFLSEVKLVLGEDSFIKERTILKKHYFLKDVYVVSGDFLKSEETKTMMAKVLLEKVNAKIKKESVVGVSGGSTMYFVASKTDETFAYGKNITFTPIRGGLSVDSTEYQSNDIAAKMANNSKHNYQLLHAPDNVGMKTLEELLKEPVVKNAIEVINKTSIIIHSIGDAFEMANRRKFSEEVLQLLREKGAVSETFGSYFANDGQEVYKTSTIGMSFDDVHGIGNVFAIVGGEDKAEAVHSYLNTKAKNTTLIIDEAICKKLLFKLKKNKKYFRRN